MVTTQCIIFKYHFRHNEYTAHVHITFWKPVATDSLCKQFSRPYKTLILIRFQTVWHSYASYSWKNCLKMIIMRKKIQGMAKKCAKFPSIQRAYTITANSDICCLLITFANSLDPDQDRQNVGQIVWHPDSVPEFFLKKVSSLKNYPARIVQNVFISKLIKAMEGHFEALWTVWIFSCSSLVDLILQNQDMQVRNYIRGVRAVRGRDGGVVGSSVAGHL